jgi:hypothetical protein
MMMMVIMMMMIVMMMVMMMVMMVVMMMMIMMISGLQNLLFTCPKLTYRPSQKGMTKGHKRSRNNALSYHLGTMMRWRSLPWTSRSRGVRETETLHVGLPLRDLRGEGLI